MLKVLFAAAAVILAAAPFAAQAQTWRGDPLRSPSVRHLRVPALNLGYPADVREARDWIRTAAEETCGRIDMPQPIEMKAEAMHCQGLFISRAERVLDSQLAASAAAAPVALAHR